MYTPPHNYMKTPKYNFLPYSYNEILQDSMFENSQKIPFLGLYVLPRLGVCAGDQIHYRI